MPDAPLILINAGAVRDAVEINARPGAIALRDGRVLAAGDPAQVRRETGEPDRVIELPDALVMPAMVNTHCHLDLTGIGSRPREGDFISWVEMVMRLRPGEEAAITEAVRRGLRLSRESGVGLIGDIAGSGEAVIARMKAPREDRLSGTSVIGCLGFGEAATEAARDVRERMRRIGTYPYAPGDMIWMGVQPHALYSAGRSLFSFAARDLPRSTHLAETKEEVQFVRTMEGPFRELLERLGKWDASIDISAKSPVAYLRHVLAVNPWLVAHCNYVDDRDIQTLAETRASVAYCPIASEYFGHEGHRYRDMIEAGVNVCLGTDSIICQPADEAQPLGILPQMRRLFRRDRIDSDTLLRMATTNGKQALGLHSVDWPDRWMSVRFDRDDKTDALAQVLINDEPARPID